MKVNQIMLHHQIANYHHLIIYLKIMREGKKISNDGIATRGNNFETDHTTHLGVRTSRVRRTTHAVVLFAVGFY